jgi:glycosyltransferase involved in cell wall biosynthesis
MKKNLLLLTVSFPFGNGEQFLETEIEYLAEEFERIIVIPAVIDNEKRSLPKNVEVDTGFAESHNLVKIFLLALLSKETWREVWQKPYILTSIRRTMRLLSFVGRGKGQFNYLVSNQHLSDDIFLYSYWFNGSAYAAYLVSKYRKSVDYIFRAHGSDLYLEAAGGYLPFRKPVIEGARRVFCISSHGAKYLIKHYTNGVFAPVTVCRLGVNNNNCMDQKTTDTKDDDTFRLISCSSLTPLKRVDLIVKTLRIIGNYSKKQVEWTHIGDGPLMNKIKYMCKDLPDNIHVTLMGRLPNYEIKNIYRKQHYDLFINTSFSEGIPVTFMEAMNCSIPVMAPAVGGIPEIVNDFTGILLPPEIDERSVANALLRIIEDPKKLEKKRKGALKMWRRVYNAEKNYARFASLLRAYAEDI